MPFELTTPGTVMFARLFGVFTAQELDQLATEAETAEATHPVSIDRDTDEVISQEQFETKLRDLQVRR